MSPAPQPGQSPTVADALAAANAAGMERLDAQWLLAQLLGRSRSTLIAHPQAALADAQLHAWRALVARHAAGEPLAYLLGEQAFHGITLQVDTRVLVPRADTEVLVNWAIELLDGPLKALPAPAVVDLGTGSGAIALAVKRACAAARLLATDLSEPALAVARENAARLGLAIEFVEGAWWSPLAGRRFDLVLSNPPYIAGDDMHLAALSHEPAIALSPGGDGLDALRAIVEHAGGHLQPAGWMLLEHGHDQGASVRALLSARGFTRIDTRRDLGGRERCTGGQLPSLV